MEQLWIGISGLFTNPASILFCILGTMLGLIVGALPGLNSTIAMSVLIPFTFGMNPSVAFCMLAGIYCGSTAGGSVTAILLKIPGTGAAVVTAFDGYEMFKKGQGGLALGISTVSSVFGGVISGIVLCFGAPFLAKQALRFGPPEYFMLAVMGLASVIGMEPKKIVKNILSMAIGLFVGIIGISPQGGVSRYTLGLFALSEGVPLVPMLIGLFGISSIFEVLESMGGVQRLCDTIKKVKMQFPSRKMYKTILPIWMQSTIIGNIVGMIPGAGMTIAVFMAYDQAKRSYPKLPFGTGIPEGVAAPECANNSVSGSSMIPLLGLGIPGNAASAVFLGALMIHGLRTGPALFRDNPKEAYTLVIAFIFCSILLLPLMLFFCNSIACYVLKLRKEVLSGLVLILCVTGAFANANSTSDIAIAIAFGFLGYVMNKNKLPMGSMILANILGTMMESNFLQTLVMADGDLSQLITRPISLVLLILTLVFLVRPIITNIKENRVGK